MVKLKKTLIFILIILFSINVTVYSYPIYGEWAEQAISDTITNHFIDNDPDKDYYLPITRIELAKLMTNILKSLDKSDLIISSITFTDTQDENAEFVSQLNIMNGYGDNTFMPDNYTTRQEMSKIVLAFYSNITNTPLVLPETFSCIFSDFNNLNEWAKPYVDKATSIGLISGYEDNTYRGEKTVSWQEVIVLLDRVYNLKQEISFAKKTYSEDFKLVTQLTDDVLYIKWNKIYPNKPCSVKINEQRLSRYEGDIPPNTPIEFSFNEETEFLFNINPNKKYTVHLYSEDKYCEKEFFTPKLLFDDMNSISSTYPTSQEEAEALMTEITVPIWKLVNNQKVSSQATFKVHNLIAEKISLVFREIFEGPEKFPIKDVNCYTWRGGKTEHNGGTAIDINSNENYCIYNDGTTIGSYWKPHEDPYSITPYGDVVRAFEKYGFTWGGDSWSNPKDYMHFSYLGT